jgi:hypothetical protein
MRHAALPLAAALAVLSAGAAAAQMRPSFDRHFLDSTEYFIAPDSMSGAYQYVAVGRLLTAATAATRNEAQFLVVGGAGGFENGQRVWTRWFWQTRPATPQDASLGATVFCLNKQEGEVYHGPDNREEALNTGWWATTVTDVSDLYRQEVRAGDYRLSLDCLRVSRSAQAVAAAAVTPAAFDGHFLDSAEYFIARQDINSGAYQYVAVGRMLVGPTETSRGEAQFLVVGGGAGYTIGQRVWTRHYMRTRPATPADVALGKRVFCLNRQEGEVYQGPRDRSEALNTGWWAVTVTDLSYLYRQEVRAGDYRLAPGCLRVER